MKVTLVRDYRWDAVKLVAENKEFTPEFVFEMDTDKVFKILKLQVELEALRQELVPLFKAAEELAKVNAEAATALTDLQVAAREAEEEAANAALAHIPGDA